MCMKICDCSGVDPGAVLDPLPLRHLVLGPSTGRSDLNSRLNGINFSNTTKHDVAIPPFAGQTAPCVNMPRRPQNFDDYSLAVDQVPNPFTIVSAHHANQSPLPRSY